MKRKRHSPEQIIAKLRDADVGLSNGQTFGQVCQKLGASEQTFHRWRNQYGGMKANDAIGLPCRGADMVTTDEAIAGHLASRAPHNRGLPISSPLPYPNRN